MRKFFILMVGFVLSLPLAAQKAPKIFPPLIYCPPPMAITIEGKLSVDAPESSFKVEQNYVFMKLNKVEVNQETGFFRLTLEQPMKPFHGVRVTVGKAPQISSQIFTVGECSGETLSPSPVGEAPVKSPEKPKPTASDALPPRILEPLYADSKTFKVQLHTSGAGLTEVHVNEEKVKASMSTADAGVVTVTLDKALVLNQEVQALAAPAGASQRVTVIAKPKPEGLPTKVKQPYESDTSLTVTVRETGVKKFDVTVNGEATKTDDAKATNQEQGVYTIPLTGGRKLKENESVAVSPDKGEPSGPVRVLAGLATDLDKPKAGAEKVTGIAHDHRATFVELYKLGEKDRLEKTTDKPDANTGKFVITIPKEKKLAAGDILVARPDLGKESAPVTVAADDKPKAPTVGVLKEGDKTVTGWVEDSNVDHAVARVLSHDNQVVDQRAGDVDPLTKVFTIGLGHVLAENDTVEVQTYKQASADNKSEKTRVVVETSEFNWGRVRAYFTLGAESSNSKADDSFKKLRPYVALNVDKNWLNFVSCYSADLTNGGQKKSKAEQVLDVAEKMKRIEKAKIRAEVALEHSGMGKVYQDRIVAERLEHWSSAVLKPKLREYENYLRTHDDWSWRCDHEPFRRAAWHVLVNTYFVARLQSAQSLQYSAQTITRDALKNAGKVASWEFGLYAPINHARTSWKFDGQRQFLFIAPLLKAGQETVPQPGAPDFSGAASLLPQDNFRVLAGGLRIGHFRAFSNSHSVSPSLISWVDFTWGRWDRLPASDLLDKNGKVRYGTRFEVAGRLKIPYSPFTIGVRTNTGAGPDEFSFFAGTRIDLTKILSKIAPAIR